MEFYCYIFYGDIMKKLFMITLGGKAKGANIEVHDVQFIIAKDIKETYKILKDNWYGVALKLHLDAYKVVDGVNGYGVSITEDKDESDIKLYFVNIGAYDPETHDEIHYYKLVPAKNREDAKKIAQENLSSKFIQVHIDNISLVEESKILNKLYSGNITLCKNDNQYRTKPDWFGYRRIDN